MFFWLLLGIYLYFTVRGFIVVSRQKCAYSIPRM